MLFNFALELVMSMVNETRETELIGIEVILAYVDDLVVQGNFRNEVKHITIKYL